MSAPRKYELTDETKIVFGVKLHRIRALVAIAAIGVAAGDLGGWVEKEENLSQVGNAWVFERAQVMGSARFEGGTFWGGTFRGGTFEGGTFRGGTFRGGTFRGGTFRGGTFEGGTFEGGTFWGGTFETSLTASRSDGYVFTFNPDPEKDGAAIAAGCRYFTFEEARTHWRETRGGTPLGDESLALVDHLERMATINGFLEPIVEEAGK